MDTLVIGAALAEHFGHREWTLIGTDRVQLDGSDDVIEISTLEIEALLSQWGDAKVSLDRIAELKKLLAETDYKVLPDYDKYATDVKAQRQAWRDEIRNLGGSGKICLRSLLSHLPP